MAKIKYILTTVVCLITFNTVGQNQSAIDSTELKMFLKDCINPIIDKDKDRLEEIVYFPLLGEWGFMMGLEKNNSLWTKQDFFDNFDSLFTDELIEKLKEKSFKDIEVYNSEDGSIELSVYVGFEIRVDDFKDESGIIFRFRKIKSAWKLFMIQGVS